MQLVGNASMPHPEGDNHDSKTYMAEDRTFLAWVQTGIALMGFGFVVACFSRFLSELEAIRSGTLVETTAFSVVLGTALIVSGVLVTLLASFQYMRRIHDIRHGAQTAGAPSELALFVGLVLSAVGLAMAVYIGTQKAATYFPSKIRQEDQGNRIRKRYS